MFRLAVLNRAPDLNGDIPDPMNEPAEVLSTAYQQIASAVRVFVDLVPSSLVDLEPGAAQALVELEHAVADRPEYLTLATPIHTLATRRS